MPAGALTQRRRHRLRHVPYVESDHELMIALSVAVSPPRPRSAAQTARRADVALCTHRRVPLHCPRTRPALSWLPSDAVRGRPCHSRPFPCGHGHMTDRDELEVRLIDICARQNNVLILGQAVCKTVGSAYVGSNPTPATTCENGPLAAETRPGGPFPSCHVVYQGASLWVDAWQCARTYGVQRPGKTSGAYNRSLCVFPGCRHTKMTPTACRSGAIFGGGTRSIVSAATPTRLPLPEPD